MTKAMIVGVPKPTLADLPAETVKAPPTETPIDPGCPEGMMRSPTGQIWWPRHYQSRQRLCAIMQRKLQERWAKAQPSKPAQRRTNREKRREQRVATRAHSGL